MKKEEHGGDIEIRRMPQVWKCVVEIGWNTLEWGGRVECWGRKMMANTAKAS